MSVTAIVVNYRTAPLTQHAAQSALADGATQVVIVDNDSADGSLEALRGIDDGRLTIVANEDNAGFGTAANIGARQSSGDVLLFLNSDAVLRPGALAAMAAAVDDEDGRVIVGPRLVGPDGEIQRSAGLVPKPDDLAIRGLGVHHLARAIGRQSLVGRVVASTRISAEYDQATTATAPIDVSMVSGACMAIGRAAFEELGGFDEHYFMYFEDADLCRRATQRGWPIRYVPAAEVDHIGGASLDHDYHFGPLHGPSMVVYLRRWYGNAGAALALFLLTVRAAASTATLRKDAGLARRAMVGGIRAYRDRRTRSPMPR